MIKKKGMKTKCLCRQSSFNYRDKKNALIGKAGEFDINRIVVIKTVTQEIMKRKCVFEQSRSKEMISFEEFLCLEEWTSLECGDVLFDSQRDDWNDQKVFNTKITGNSQLVIVIDDGNGNTFGGFINEPLDKMCCGEKHECIRDPESFLFSLKSNGRLPGMMKFESIEKDGAVIELYIHDDPDWNWGPIINFGDGDLRICKYPKRNDSRCNFDWGTPQYDFHGIEYPLRGTKECFIPKRFIVIQMI